MNSKTPIENLIINWIYRRSKKDLCSFFWKLYFLFNDICLNGKFAYSLIILCYLLEPLCTLLTCTNPHPSVCSQQMSQKSSRYSRTTSPTNGTQKEILIKRTPQWSIKLSYKYHYFKTFFLLSLSFYLHLF